MLSDKFFMQTGLGQGCCLAPLLFNVILAAVMESWENKQPNKIPLKYCIDGVFRRRMDEGTLNKYATWEALLLRDLGYADDSTFITDTYEKPHERTCNLQEHYSDWGRHRKDRMNEYFGRRSAGHSCP